MRSHALALALLLLLSHSLTLLLSRAIRFARSPGTALHPDGMDASELERRAVRVLCVGSPHRQALVRAVSS